MSEQETAKKKIIFSGIQPTGVPTLGNYIGALRNWTVMQDEYHCVYSIVDEHAITIRKDPQEFRQQILSSYALMMACGIDPQKSIYFIQSHVPAHVQLSWVLSCYTQFGELSRMTQFKDKSAKHPENVNAGLFTYPVLMAADILLYQADLVPVGDDQKQHVEICRDIANRFNGVYGNVFTLPEAYIPKKEQGARIMSLAEPTRKMSKSDENPNGYISILDPPETIIKKCKRAVTDSDTEICYAEGKDGINNLMTIYSVLSGRGLTEIEAEFAGRGYGYFKEQVGNCVSEALRPIQEKYKRLIDDRAYLEECYRLGAEKASHFAQRTMDKVYKKIGFLPLTSRK